MPADPVTWACIPAGSDWPKCARSASTARSPPASGFTVRLTVISSSCPSALRIIDSSSGSDSGVWTLDTMSRRSAGASGPVIHDAVCATKARSASVRPDSRDKVIVADPTETSRGNARSSATRARIDSVPGGRNALWSVDPTLASDGAKASAAIAAATHATRIANRNLKVSEPSRSNITRSRSRVGRGLRPVLAVTKPRRQPAPSTVRSRLAFGVCRTSQTEGAVRRESRWCATRRSRGHRVDGRPGICNDNPGS